MTDREAPRGAEPLEPGSSPIGELARAVRAGRVSSAELVAEALARIERDNDHLNAVTAVFPERALAAARAFDEGEREGPLAGLPLLVKDTTDVEGLVTNFASRAMVDRPVAERSDIAVERLTDAGAIVIGRTNSPEFAFQGWTDNDVFGATRNPWGTDWSPGGSSGGSGAALAAALAPLATGTDGGGSIRTPATFCGLVGLKPTAGAIGRRPIPSWIEVSTHGPMARTVQDARLLFEVMRGPAEGDPGAPALWTDRDEMPRRVFAADRTWDYGPLPAEVADPWTATVDAIERDLGLPVERVSPRDIWPWAIGCGGHPSRDWYVTVCVEELTWLGRGWVEERMDSFSSAFRGEMESALEITVDDYLDARRRRFDYALDLDRLLGDDAVLVCPTHGYAGWRPDGMLADGDRLPGGEAYNTGEFNLSGHPSLSLPGGMASNGLPFGFLVNGPRWRDDMVLAFGAAWERAHPWPAIAPGYGSFATP
ncbi:MAG TPA: amidase [Actinomycetota bacterium]|nr:amidase [Actinomycetota bacterium]